jgi:hypothetical protein
MTVSYSKNLGRYNLCSADKSWSLHLNLPKDAPARGLSQLFDEDQEPQIEGCVPSEIVEMISERLESYLFSTDRPEKRKVIEWCRANADRLNSEWAKSEIERCKAKIERLQREMSGLADYILPEEQAA